jgi:outer membrane protein assembly factor BamB
MSQTNLALSEIWRISDLVVWSPAYQTANFVLTDEQLIAVDYQAGVPSGKVISYNTNDGVKLWEFDYNKRAVSSMAYNQDSLFIASAGEPVNAFNLQTGQLVWISDNVLTDRRTNSLHAQGDILLNYAFKDGLEIIHSFDPKTGDTLNLERLPLDVNRDGVLLMRLDGVEFRQRPSSLTKINRETGEIIWATTINSGNGFTGGPYLGILYFPILYENKLVIVSGRIDLAVDVIDYTTGEHLWRADSIFISNAGVNDGKVYALRDDARLEVLDIDTGIELGYVQFTPEQTDPTENAYWVGVDEQERVFVYFGDSQELMALTPTAP